VTLVVAYGLSFVLVERIYHAGREKLMRIEWLSRLIQAVGDDRDACLGWLRGTEAWKRAQSVLAIARERLSRVFGSLKTRS
jgi:hypothetical protein